MPPILFRLTSPNARQGSSRLGVPPFIASMPVTPAQYLRIFGVTKDSTGAILAGATVRLYRTATDVLVDSTVSDGVGVYEFRVGLSQSYYVVAYKAGSPDLAGTTVNTLVGA